MIVTAIPAGFAAGLFGIGGGLITVPILFYIFGSAGLEPTYLMHLAVGTSFGIIIPTSIVSVLTHHQHKAVDFSIVKGYGVFVIIGVILGSIGIYLLVSQKQLIHQEGSIKGMLMIFAGMVSWSYGSIFVAKADLPTNFFVNTGYQMLMGGLMLLIASFSFGEEWVAITNWSTSVHLSMLGLIVFGSIVAFTSFNYLLRAVSPEKVATSTYVNPVIALLLGWFFLNEQITLQSILAAAILLMGVFFINTKKKMVLFSRFKKQ